ncbi:MAG: PQQ-binding-like beta-propeller repeat protein, partial [Chloroflexota bacterium]
MVVTIVIAIFAILQRNTAVTNENLRATAQSHAEAAGATAVAESFVRATAQANADTQSIRANEEAKVALARSLAAQADLLISQEPKKLSLAVLLSLESLKKADTFEGSLALRKGLSLLPDMVSKFKILSSSSSYNNANPISVVKFSPDGRWLGVGTETIISVWDVSTWKEILHVEPAKIGGVVAQVRALAFSEDGRYLITGTDARIAQVWDVASGKELSRMEHTDQIFIVGFTPDGKRAISGSGEVIVWDPQTGKEFYRVKAGTMVLAVSPDGKIAAAAAGTDITVWDVETGKILQRKTQFTRFDKYNDLRSISALVFSPDGSKIASSEGKTSGVWITPRPASIGGRILVWDPITGKDISSMQHGDEVPALAFSSDGKRLVSGSFDNTSRVWDVATGRPLSDFSFDSSVGAVAFGGKDDWIVSSSYDGTARVWDARTGEEINRLVTENDTNLETIAMSPNGAFVAGGNSEGVWVWQIQGQELTKMEHGQALTISSVAYSLDGKMLVTASWDRKARTWDTKTGLLIASVTHENQIFMSVFSPDGKYAASADKGGQVKVWESRSGIEPFQIPKFKEVSQVLFSPDGSLLAISEGLYSRDSWSTYAYQADREGGVVSIWDVAKRKEIASFMHAAIVNSIAFSPDGRQILSAGKDGVARLWDIGTKTMLYKVEIGNYVNIVAISPDGQLAAGVESCLDVFMGSNCSKLKLQVWKLATGEILWGTRVGGRWISNMSFSPNSKLLVTENNYTDSCSKKDCKNSVVVWNALKGGVISKKDYEAAFGLMVLAFNKDGSLLASGGGPPHSGWVDIWEPETGIQVSRITDQQPMSAAFDPTGKAIAITGNQDGVAYARIFSLDISNLADAACARIKRNLTEQEWKDYLGKAPFEKVCPGFTPPVSNDPDGGSSHVKISKDGQWISFISAASNLVCGETNPTTNFFLYHMEDGRIQRVTKSSEVAYEGYPTKLEITGDGRYIVFSSFEENLVANDVNKKSDIFLFDRTTGKTELISVNSKNIQADDDSHNPSISEDGRYVFFDSAASNLVPGDTNKLDDVFVHDRKTGTTSRILLSPNNPPDKYVTLKWVSPDLQKILFYSNATNLGFPLDFEEDAWYLVDQKSSRFEQFPFGLEDGNDKFGVGIQNMSSDGSAGEFSLGEVALYDFETKANKIISADPAGDRGNHDSESPAISDDGRWVAFASEANNLVASDTNIAWDVFLWERKTGQIRRVVMGLDGSQPNGHAHNVDMSGDGRYIVFTSGASNLIERDLNEMNDVFIYDSASGTTKRIEPMLCLKK